MTDQKSHTADAHRIAKNSMMLYIRMFLMLVISLYSSRIVLKALGIEDYGIYNVIGGLITIFSFINNSMAQASQRFLAYELGASQSRMRTIFSTSVYIHVALSVVIILLAETVGLWYVYNVAVIPADRFFAALCIYQFSILIAVTTILTVPYNSLIIAHERMSAFAYLSLIEAALKLVIAWLILICPYDRLIVYGMLMAIVAVMMRVVYGIYASRHFSESKLTRNICLTDIHQMGTFAGWSIFGSVAAVGYTQGLNLLLNAFFNPAVNAARGVAVTVQAVIRNFSGNFQMALNPHITKSWASGEMDYLRQVIYRASRLTGCLYILVALPVFIEIDTLLSLWLVKVPEYTATFIRLLLLVSMFEVLASPLNTSIQATGHIKAFELICGLIMLAVVPLSYIALRVYDAPAIVFAVFLAVTVIAFGVRMVFTRKYIAISLRYYIINVIGRLTLMVATGCIVPAAIFFATEPSTSRFIAIFATSILFTCIGAYAVVLAPDERKLILSKVCKRSW